MIVKIIVIIIVTSFGTSIQMKFFVENIDHEDHGSDDFIANNFATEANRNEQERPKAKAEWKAI